jgi:hypothetical protein
MIAFHESPRYLYEPLIKTGDLINEKKRAEELIAATRPK